MAPKRKVSGKRPKTTPTPPSTSATVETVGGAPHRFHTREAELRYRAFMGRTIVQERGLTVEPPFEAYIEQARWRTLAQAPVHGGDRELTLEFYSNLVAEPSDRVFVRGARVPITPQAINQYYGLPAYPVDAYRQLLVDGVDERDLNFTLTGSSDPLPPAWTHIKKEELTLNAKYIYYFVAARLLPTVVNSEVLKHRALLTYAILKGMLVDVGQIIYLELRTGREARAQCTSFGFPALIYGLTRAAGYVAPTLGAVVVKNKAPISFHLLAAGNRHPIQHQHEEAEEAGDDAVPPTGPRTVEERLNALDQSVLNLRAQMDDGFTTLQDYLDGQFADIRSRLQALLPPRS